MSIRSKLQGLGKITNSLVSHPGWGAWVLRTLPESVRGHLFSAQWPSGGEEKKAASSAHRKPMIDEENPLRKYFDSHQTGRGIWKWNHYFDIYHNHFRKFVGREVHIVEVGIYSGGSLEMWKEYFGPRCRVYGVDIEAACKCYEGDRVQVFIGDQADRSFWRKFREQVPTVDILVDDGGHFLEQQIVTLEEMLPHISPGGVYLCEDIHTLRNPFIPYVSGLANGLNASENEPPGLQRYINSVHLYPYVAVIEKCESLRDQLVAPRHGTEWQPFL